MTDSNIEPTWLVQQQTQLALNKLRQQRLNKLEQAAQLSVNPNIKDEQLRLLLNEANTFRRAVEIISGEKI